MRRPHWRKMTWVLIAWSALILVWAIGGGTSAANDCAKQTGDAYLSAHAAQEACNTGTGIGIAAIVILGFIGFVVLSLIWFMTRPKGRDCPACGTNVKRGHIRCGSCGHDFAAAAALQQASVPA